MVGCGFVDGFSVWWFLSLLNLCMYCGDGRDVRLSANEDFIPDGHTKRAWGTNKCMICAEVDDMICSQRPSLNHRRQKTHHITTRQLTTSVDMNSNNNFKKTLG